MLFHHFLPYLVATFFLTRSGQMLHWDVFNGVSRRAWAGNANALAYTAAEQSTNGAYAVQYPHKVDGALLAAAVAQATTFAK